MEETPILDGGGRPLGRPCPQPRRIRPGVRVVGPHEPAPRLLVDIAARHPGARAGRRRPRPHLRRRRWAGVLARIPGFHDVGRILRCPFWGSARPVAN